MEKKEYVLYEEKAYYSKFTPQRLWIRKRIKEILKLLDSTGPLLDIGSGSSLLLSKLSMMSVGIDIDKNTIHELSGRKPGYNLIVASGRYLPFKNGIFNLITCTEVIEHVNRPEDIIKESHRVLRDNGQMIISTPNYLSLWPILEVFWSLKADVRDYNIEHQTHFNYFKLKKMLQTRGFEVITLKSVFLFYPFFSMINEWLTKKIEKLDDNFSSFTKLGMLLIIKGKKTQKIELMT